MFLPFGTIAPGILLSLLGFAYMLFFGSYALNRASKDDQLETPAKQILAERPVASFSEASTFRYPVTDNNLCAAIQQTNDRPGIRPAASIIIIIPDEDPYSDPHRFSFFARPPPFTTPA
jgi:hypothetical protein